MSERSRRKVGTVDHPMAGSRRKQTINPSDMLSEASGAIEKLKELEQQDKEEPVSEKPQNISELRDLLFFGKIIEKVQLGGFIFEITSLTNKQHNYLIAELLKMDPDDRILYIKPYTLAESLISINGVPTEQLIEEEGMTVFERRLAVITQLQSLLVENLFEKYEEINSKSNDTIKGEGVRDKLKNS